MYACEGLFKKKQKMHKLKLASAPSKPHNLVYPTLTTSFNPTSKTRTPQNNSFTHTHTHTPTPTPTHTPTHTHPHTPPHTHIYTHTPNPLTKFSTSVCIDKIIAYIS